MDFKSNRNSPSQIELDTSWQFTMYSYAAMHADLNTKGIWPEKNVWWHLRGKEVFPKTAKRKAVRQFFFETTRTPEFVEREFVETIEPLAARMEGGDFIRIRGKHCAYCSYFDQKRQDCGVDLPTRQAIHGGSDIETIPNTTRLT